MTALGAGRTALVQPAGLKGYVVADNVKIYKNALINIDSSGYARPARDNSGDTFAGIAQDYVDNTLVGHVAGTVANGPFVNVQGNKHVSVVTSGATQGSVGLPFYVQDDQTLTSSATSNNIFAGVCTAYRSATDVDIFIPSGPQSPLNVTPLATVTATALAGSAATFPMTGLAGSGAGAGGTVAPVGGAGGATGVGGAATLTGGAGGATSGTGGASSVVGGAGTGTNAIGGAASVTGGAGHGTQAGGAAGLVGGLAGATGTGGAVAVTGGGGGATSGTGGAVVITGGAGTANGVGGAASLIGGAGTLSNAGGAVAITGGASGTTGSQAGGAVTITGGAAGSGSVGAGGDVNLVGGAADSTGAPGEVKINGSANGITPASWYYNVPTNLTQSFFSAARAYRVKHIDGYPTVAGTGGACTASFYHAPSGTALSAGTILHSGSFNLVGTINTVQTLTLAAAASLAISAGDQVGVIVTGTATSAIGSVTITLVPV